MLIFLLLRSTEKWISETCLFFDIDYIDEYGYIVKVYCEINIGYRFGFIGQKTEDQILCWFIPSQEERLWFLFIPRCQLRFSMKSLEFFRYYWTRIWILSVLLFRLSLSYIVSGIGISYYILSLKYIILWNVFFQ